VIVSLDTSDSLLSERSVISDLPPTFAGTRRLGQHDKVPAAASAAERAVLAPLASRWLHLLGTESQCQLFRIRWTERSSERAVDSRVPSEAQRILGARRDRDFRCCRAAVLLDAFG
jgi:hypothetical protein